MMKRRQSGRARGARVSSDMRRALTEEFVNKAMRTATILLTHFQTLSNSARRAGDASQNPLRSGIVQRRPLGVRLRFADVAAGLRLYRAGPGAADRRASRALRLF